MTVKVLNLLSFSFDIPAKINIWFAVQYKSRNLSGIYVSVFKDQ